jgi:glycogen debranching enzyme
MNSQPLSLEKELVPIAPPSEEPRLVFQTPVSRKVDNLTLIDGKAFLSTTVSGDIVPPGAPDVGFFHDDTRFLSHLELRVSGQPVIVLSSSTERTFVSQIELTTASIKLRDSFDVAENTIHIRRHQLLDGSTLFDRLLFENFNREPLELTIELTFDADFVDVFQVRGTPRKVHGQYYEPIADEKSVTFCYRGLDGTMRRTRIEVEPQPAHIEHKRVLWKVSLAPSKHAEIQVAVTPIVGEEEGAGKQRKRFAQSLQDRRNRYNDWERSSTQFRSNQSIFDTALSNAIGDFHALQIHEGQHKIIAAGIPWFATMFGRDSLIAAYQTLTLNPDLALDTLRVLASYQGKEYNDWLDEEPGKILHEYREGEMTRCGEMPFSPYYGTIDATPLFLILLSEVYNWTADEAAVQELLPAAYAALDWIDRYGDLDGDGLVEYQRRSSRGLANQNWKDSWDANLHKDGSVAPSPIAPVEVQGYVYDAKYRMASLLRSFGDVARAERLKKEAADLAKRIDRAYWMPEQNFFAMALDGHKKKVESIASNPGHLLFTRSISRERCRAVINRLMKEDMFSGWGWRTLSRENSTFNPLSYHRGSVWPHDNSLIAHGMALNEFRGPAIRALTALFQAAVNFRDYRLPELFCGVQRREHDEPVHYPVSCSPQAWASGSWFLILNSVLGIRPSAPRKELNIINPELPDWLDYLRIRNLRIGKSRVSLDFTRHGDRTFCNVVDVHGDRLLVNVAFKK